VQAIWVCTVVVPLPNSLVPTPIRYRPSGPTVAVTVE
jgi:hypothetical protein